MNPSIKQLIKGLKDTADSNPMIKGFGVGQVDQINVSGNTFYPLIFCTLQPAIKNSDTTININYKVYSMDMLLQDNSNEQDIESDTLQILNDYLNEVDKYFYNTSSKVTVKYNSQYIPFTDRFTDYLSGWESTVTFTCSTTNNYC